MESSRLRDTTKPLASIGSTGQPPMPSQVRTTCLLTPLHPERSLSHALVQHLSQEMPDIEFSLQCDQPDVIWVCGYEPGSETLIEELRSRNPLSAIVVTGRGSVISWEDQVHAAGGDYCCGWPLPMNDLTQILRRA